jgi:hypothetical protein
MMDAAVCGCATTLHDVEIRLGQVKSMLVRFFICLAPKQRMVTFL